jgi:hypothetical protein
MPRCAPVLHSQNSYNVCTLIFSFAACHIMHLFFHTRNSNSTCVELARTNCIYGVCTLVLARKRPQIRYYTVCICDSVHPLACTPSLSAQHIPTPLLHMEKTGAWCAQHHCHCFRCLSQHGAQQGWRGVCSMPGLSLRVRIQCVVCLLGCIYCVWFVSQGAYTVSGLSLRVRILCLV